MLQANFAKPDDSRGLIQQGVVQARLVDSNPLEDSPEKLFYFREQVVGYKEPAG